MTSRSLPYLLFVLVLLSGCRSASRDERQEDSGEVAESAHINPAEQPESNILTVDPDMVRDLRLTSAPAELRASGEGVTALGELRVNEDAYAEVRAPVPARASKLLVGIGDEVTPAQPLLELQSVEVGKAVADYVRDRAHAQLAAQTLERKRGLAAERILPQRELQESEADAAAATADLEAAAATLTALGIRMGDVRSTDAFLTLRAPIAGTVLDRSVVLGQMVDPAVTLMRIADLSRLWLIAHVFERDAVRVDAGAAVKASFPALPGRTYAGTVARVGEQVDPSSRTIPIRIEVENDGVLRPGMSANAWVPLRDSGANIVAVPSAALQRCDDGWCVFIARDASTFEVRPVGRGRDLGGGEVEVLNGLQAGKTVIVDGAFLLKAERERSKGEGEHHEH